MFSDTGAKETVLIPTMTSLLPSSCIIFLKMCTSIKTDFVYRQVVSFYPTLRGYELHESRDFVTLIYFYASGV